MREGLGIALLPRSVVENLNKEINTFHIFNELSQLEITLFAITRKDKNLSTTVHTLVKRLQEN
jgi:DNA-binding transcriptional LysR family regulator